MTDFVLQITDWYRLNGRDLPWRRTKNAYFIWLSEVILQQTRVDQGMSYYLKFVESFPSVTDLANSDEEKVLKLWQGLGYYSRARNLHGTAKEIQSKFGGNLPPSYEDLLSLKGVGPYTAAAVASFAFDLPHAVVDGNVYRVLSRYFGIDSPIDSTTGKKEFQQLADSLIPDEAPALFNQSIMEFGAMLCTPKNPDCDNCPVVNSCASGRSGLWRERPVKAKKTLVRDRYFHYFHIEKNGQTAIRKRIDKDVWLNLYEFPMIESHSAELLSEEISDTGLIPGALKETMRTKHVLSHQRIHAIFYEASDFGKLSFKDILWVSAENLAELPIHRLMDKYLEQL